VQAIEHGDEVVVFARKFLCLGYLEGNSVGNAVALGIFAGRFNRLVVIVEPEESRLEAFFAIM
jgi:hypothetical protein